MSTGIRNVLPDIFTLLIIPLRNVSLRSSCKAKSLHPISQAAGFPDLRASLSKKKSTPEQWIAGGSFSLFFFRKQYKMSGSHQFHVNRFFLFQRDYFIFKNVYQRLCAVIDLELMEDTREVVFHRLFAES